MTTQLLPRDSLQNVRRALIRLWASTWVKVLVFVTVFLWAWLANPSLAIA